MGETVRKRGPPRHRDFKGSQRQRVQNLVFWAAESKGSICPGLSQVSNDIGLSRSASVSCHFTCPVLSFRHRAAHHGFGDGVQVRPVMGHLPGSWKSCVHHSIISQTGGRPKGAQGFTTTALQDVDICQPCAVVPSFKPKLTTTCLLAAKFVEDAAHGPGVSLPRLSIWQG